MASCATTRSTVLLAPKGLPQLMQAKGSVLEHDRACRGSREIEPGHQRDDPLGTGRLAQAALHAGILLEAKLRPVGIVLKRARGAGADASKAKRAAR
jgi:hypothetical protein